MTRRTNRAANRNAGRRAAELVAKKKEGELSFGVHVSACLEREKVMEDGVEVMPEYPGQDQLGYQNSLDNLYVDQYGNMVACAGCQRGVFVCTKDEIPLFVEFFQKAANQAAATGKSA